MSKNFLRICSDVEVDEDFVGFVSKDESGLGWTVKYVDGK